MRYTISQDWPPLEGRLVYRIAEHSLDFEPVSRGDVARRAGDEGTTSISVGTLQMEFGVATGVVLFVWGYYPQTLWRGARLPPIAPSTGCLSVRLDERATRGASIGLAAAGEWDTFYDAQTGWLYVGHGDLDAARRYVEFAHHTVAGVAGDELMSLWLRPAFSEA